MKQKMNKWTQSEIQAGIYLLFGFFLNFLLVLYAILTTDNQNIPLYFVLIIICWIFFGITLFLYDSWKNQAKYIKRYTEKEKKQFEIEVESRKREKKYLFFLPIYLGITCTLMGSLAIYLGCQSNPKEFPMICLGSIFLFIGFLTIIIKIIKSFKEVQKNA
ncbi:MAG: hypothetical protein HFH86_00230 [Bacilli bacterium]|jgi:MFS family permease|nr:hypothetical protein [Bacilli bacterium]